MNKLKLAIAAALGLISQFPIGQRFSPKEMPQAFIGRPKGRSGTRPRISGKANPPGSKFLRRAYKNHHGGRGTYEKASEWYSSLEG